MRLLLCPRSIQKGPQPVRRTGRPGRTNVTQLHQKVAQQSPLRTQRVRHQRAVQLPSQAPRNAISAPCDPGTRSSLARNAPALLAVAGAVPAALVQGAAAAVPVPDHGPGHPGLKGHGRLHAGRLHAAHASERGGPLHRPSGCLPVPAPDRLSAVDLTFKFVNLNRPLYSPPAGKSSESSESDNLQEAEYHPFQHQTQQCTSLQAPGSDQHVISASCSAAG